MTGGLMQLVAYGAQDIYLTGNAHITFFKSVYRRHTNFAIEAIEQTLSGQADFGNRVTSIISRNGDLINRMYVQATLPALSQSGSFRWVDDVGHHLLKEMEVEIGGQMIDRQYGDWLQIWMLLTLPSDKQDGYNKMIGQDGQTYPNGVEWDTSLQAYTENDKPERTLFIPLQFWFCRHAGLSLPLIALQYHEVKIILTFRKLDELIISSENTIEPASLINVKLWADYIYLDTDERRRMAQVSHEYLIEQVQHNGDQTLTGSRERIKMTFNHPVKELIWFVRHDTIEEENQWSNYTNLLAETEAAGAPDKNHRNPNDSMNPVTEAKLLLNGQDRFSARSGDYFNLVQPYQHHTRIPESPGLNVYSFGLHPEAHQPSGTVNMSRIDVAELQLTLAFEGEADNRSKLYVYATNYNVLRIMSGMGGLAYSN